MHTSFEDSAVLGKFNNDCAAIGKQIDARAEELRAAYQRIKMLEADLLECREFIEPHIDIVDGSDGQPAPNKAMQLVSMIDDSIHGPGNY
jgi:hypothetical protein